MRLDAIHLPAYGPFTDAALDLSGGRGKLEVVYGPNEAGKSSLLRAICDFLFGIPAQTRDGFLHGYGSLRIGARVEREGKTLDAVRRKANTKSLRDAADEDAIGDDVLRWFVPIENRDLFQTMFGLDAARLQEGGDELVKGKSQFGQLLFSAAAGIEGLHDVLEKLNAEAEKLYKPRASTAAIAKILDRLKESKDQLRNATITTTQLNELQEEREKARAESRGIEDELGAKASETERLKRIRLSLGLLGTRAGVKEQLGRMAEARVLRDGFADEHRKAAAGLSMKSNEVRDAARRVADLKEELAAIDLPEVLLAREPEVLSLHQETGRQRKDAKDRDRLQTELAQAEAEMTYLLRSLGDASGLERVPGLLVRAADERAVQELSASRASLDAEMKGCDESLADERRKLEAARRELEALPAAKVVAGLRGAVQSALLAAKTETTAQRVAKAAEAERRKIAEAVAALPWLRGLESLDNSAVPSEAVVAEWTTRLDKAEQGEEQAAERLRAAQGEVATLQARLAKLQAGRAVPPLAQLAIERQRRDLGWRAVRGAWLENEMDSAAAREFLREPGDGPALAKAYEASVGQTDATADVLREEAEQVARLEHARVDLDAARKAVAARAAELAEVQLGRGRAVAEWEALWAAFQVPAGAPRQMAAWLQRRAAILTRLHALEAQEAQATELLRETETATLRLREELVELGETATPATNTLAGWRARAEQVVETQDKLANQRERLVDEIQAGERAVAAAQDRIRKAQAELGAWNSAWSSVMHGRGLSPATKPAEAQETIRERANLQKHWRTADERKGRIAGIDRDAARFREQLRGLLEAVAPELVAMPELDAVAEIYQRLSRALKQRDLRTTKTQDLEREEKALGLAEAGRKKAENLLAALAAEAQCEDVERLPALIEDSARRRDLDRRLAEVDEQLGSIGVGRSVAQLEEEARGVEADGIPGQLEGIVRQMEEARARLKAAEERRITLENRLRAMEESADCCAASADVEAHKAEALEAVEQFVRLQLARGVLKGAVERYREKAQGEMLERSSGQFAVLTGGSFSGLKLDWDESGGVVLVGVRAGSGAKVQLAGMSDGTRDQLYLALRLASMELYAKDHEPIPFILDDILVQFDNGRSVAAIRALAELAKHTQVLLFTHHEHVVELARESLRAEELAVTRIAGGARAGARG